MGFNFATEDFMDESNVNINKKNINYSAITIV